MTNVLINLLISLLILAKKKDKGYDLILVIVNWPTKFIRNELIKIIIDVIDPIEVIINTII